MNAAMNPQMLHRATPRTSYVSKNPRQYGVGHSLPKKKSANFSLISDGDGTLTLLPSHLKNPKLLPINDQNTDAEECFPRTNGRKNTRLDHTTAFPQPPDATSIARNEKEQPNHAIYTNFGLTGRRRGAKASTLLIQAPDSALQDSKNRTQQYPAGKSPPREEITGSHDRTKPQIRAKAAPSGSRGAESGVKIAPLRVPAATAAEGEGGRRRRRGGCTAAGGSGGRRGGSE